MASALEHQGHRAEIVPFNSDHDTASGCIASRGIRSPNHRFSELVFNHRATKFCKLADAVSRRLLNPKDKEKQQNATKNVWSAISYWNMHVDAGFSLAHLSIPISPEYVNTHSNFGVI